MGTQTVAVVPSWNGRRLLERFLPSWLAQSLPFARVIVVDNGSGDGTRELIAATPEVEFLRLLRNLGFAAAVNRGIARALADPEVGFVAVVNNDVALDREWHRRAVAAIGLRPEYGSCATCVLRDGWGGELESAGIAWEDGGVAGNRLAGQPPPPTTGDPMEVWGAAAAAAVYRRELLEGVGLFNETFFAYQEDVELAVRARRVGWRCVLAPAARARHVGLGSNRPFPLGGTFADYYNARNRIAVVLGAVPANQWRRHWRKMLGCQLRLLAASLPERRAGAVWAGALHGLWRAPASLAARRRTARGLARPIEERAPWLASTG